MKQVFLSISLIITFCLASSAQQQGKIVYPGLKNKVVNCPVNAVAEDRVIPGQKSSESPVKSLLSATEFTIGNTWFDYQTNGSMPQRIYQFSDGAIGAAWSYGMSSPLYADRGTGYNFYDAGAWGLLPSSRIEDVKTGTPNYAAWGPAGEIIVAHTNTTSGLKIAKRSSKGSGNWSFMIRQGPSGNEKILWPRMVTNCNNNEFIHVFALTAPLANGGALYNGQDGALLYSRSNNGGNTWSIDNIVIPGTDTSFYPAFNADCYALANPVGNTLALVYGNTWSDVFLLKSTDNGDTWTKTIIYSHPYPKFRENTTLVTDTPYVCDNSLAVALDNTGKAHVFFGIMRVMNDIVGDSSFSLFPYTDGLAYWNESQPAFSSLNPTEVDATGNLVGWTQDVNGNDTIMEFVSNPANYKGSVTSMPTVTIDQGNNRIYVFFTSIVEGLDNTFQNYRHIYSRRSDDGGATWTVFNDITGASVHDGDECVFPSVSPTSEEYYCHLVYQKDQQPGMSFDGDMDPAGNNDIVYLKFPKLTTGLGSAHQPKTWLSVYPNPVEELMVVEIQSEETGMVSLEITDLPGRVIYRHPEMKLNTGSQSITLAADNWAPGLYMLTMKTNGSSISRKVIVR
jgi:hypothetical protein